MLNLQIKEFLMIKKVNYSQNLRDGVGRFAANCRHLFLFGFFALGVFLISACPAGGGGTTTPSMVNANSITINESNALQVTNGASGTLPYFVLPNNHGDGDVTWSSTSNVIIVSNIIDSSSNVDRNRINYYTVGAGTGTITGVVGSASNSIGVTVTANIRYATNIVIDGGTNLEFTNGASGILSYSILPVNHTNQGNVTWSSTDTNVITVSSANSNSINYNALMAGSATIIGVLGEASNSVDVTVTRVVPATNITIDQSAFIATNGRSFQLTASVLPTNHTSGSVFWNFSNNIVTLINSGVSNATFIPNSAGAETIKAVIAGKTNVVTIEVRQPPEGVVINGGNFITTNDANDQLTATVTPSNYIGTVTWSSDNTNILSLSGSGETVDYSPISNGVVEVTATIGTRSFSIGVTVVRVVTNILLSNNLTVFGSNIYTNFTVIGTNSYYGRINYVTNTNVFTIFFRSNGAMGMSNYQTLLIQDGISNLTNAHNVSFTNFQYLNSDISLTSNFIEVRVPAAENPAATNYMTNYTNLLNTVMITNWTNYDFSGTDLSYLDMSGYVFSNANFSNVDMIGANLSGASFVGATGLTNISLSNVTATGADFRGVNMAGVNLHGASMASVQFDNAVLAGANLSGIVGANIDFSAASMSGVMLVGAQINDAVFTGANLSNGSLRNAVVRRGNFSNAYLTSVSIDYGNFSSANFIASTFREASGHSNLASLLNDAVLDFSGYLHMSRFPSVRGFTSPDVIRLPSLSGAPSADNIEGSVSISGNFAIVGSAGKSSNTGSAFFLERNIFGQWVNSQEITNAGASANQHFGYAAAIAGNYAIISAYGESNNRGAAQIYQRSGNLGSSTLMAFGDKVTTSDAGDELGKSVDIWSEGFTFYAIIGAVGDDDAATDAGAAYIRERVSGQESRTVKLTPSDGGSTDRFGRSVAIYENYAAIGAWRDDNERGSDVGAVYVFYRQGETNWVQSSKIMPPNGNEDDGFGVSVGIWSNRLIVGSVFNNFGGVSNSGSAYIYELSGNGSSTTLITNIGVSNGNADDRFGISVDIWGDKAIVGAYYDDDRGANAGAAYLYFWNGSTWMGEKLSSVDGVGGDLDPNLNFASRFDGDRFGHVVSISDNEIIVGDYNIDPSAPLGSKDSIDAYVFEIPGME